MRDIKLRAWDSVNEIMIPFIELIAPEEPGKPYTDKSRPDALKNLPNGFCITSLMQYTGLKDKNGKEIYEGDIIGSKTCSGVVTFENGSFMWQDTPLGFDEENIYSKINPEKWAEVFGNLHENPDLLKP